MDNEKKDIELSDFGDESNEKPKDFIGSIKKLLYHLRSFMPIILIALIVSSIAAVLSIIGPNKLSNATDAIGKGIAPKEEKLEQIVGDITKVFQDENKMMLKTEEILISVDISNDDKLQFQKILEESDSQGKDIQEAFLALPDSVMLKLLDEIKVDGKIISPNEQLETLKVIGSLDEKDVHKSLKNLENLPKPVYDLVKPSMDLTYIKGIVIFLIVIYLISSICDFIQYVIMARVSAKFTKNLREKIEEKINKLPLKYFDTHKIGDVLSRVTNDVDRIGQTMSDNLGTLISETILFLGTIFMMFHTNVIMAITAILSSLLGFLFMFGIFGKSQKYFDKKQQELGKMNGHIEEVYSSLNVIKTYHGKEKEYKKFTKLNKELFDANLKSGFLSELMEFFMGFIGHLGYVAVCIVGGILVIKGNISFGVIVAFMLYVELFTSPLSQIASSVASMQSTLASSERVFEFLEEDELLDESNVKIKLDPSTVKGNIEFNHVKFGYEKDKMIIKDFCLKAHQGEKIAIVGPTGAGKTTLVNLLMKFYETNSGEILIDGVNIKDITRNNIHNLFVMVLQDTWLFNGTIKENIKYNKKNITDEQIWEALDTVGIRHFVETLPDNLDYEITDNESISAGQKQLLTIARGMVENAPFLILDEATSSVDTRTEELVQKAMDKLTEGRTSFIIAHRLSTIKNADKILVMKDGNIVEQGNHNELLAKNGFYAELYNSQFQNG